MFVLAQVENRFLCVADNLHSKVQQYQQLLRQVTQQRLEVAEVEENIALQQQKLTNLSRMGKVELLLNVVYFYISKN